MTEEAAARLTWCGDSMVRVDPKLTITQHSTVSTGSIIAVRGYVLFLTVCAAHFHTTASTTSSRHDHGYKPGGDASICTATMATVAGKGFLHLHYAIWLPLHRWSVTHQPITTQFCGTAHCISNSILLTQTMHT